MQTKVPKKCSVFVLTNLCSNGIINLSNRGSLIRINNIREFYWTLIRLHYIYQLTKFYNGKDGSTYEEFI